MIVIPATHTSTLSLYRGGAGGVYNQNSIVSNLVKCFNSIKQFYCPLLTSNLCLCVAICHHAMRCERVTPHVEIFLLMMRTPVVRSEADTDTDRNGERGRESGGVVECVRSWPVMQETSTEYIDSLLLLDETTQWNWHSVFVFEQNTGNGFDGNVKRKGKLLNRQTLSIAAIRV